MFFHSLCIWISLSPVFFHSVLSANCLAFSTSFCFFSRFSAYWLLIFLKNSAFLLKNSSLAIRKRSKIFTFIFWGAKPIFFHSPWISMIALVASSQSEACFFSFRLIASIFSQRAVLLARFSSSLARRSSKCCWCFLLITVLAFLKRVQISSRSSFATGPISRYSWCRSCNWWKAEITSGSSASFSAASQSLVFASRFFLKSYSRASLLSFRRS